MTTDNVYVPQQGSLSDLAGWIAGDLGAALVRLYDSFVLYSPTLTPAAFHEASFTGYAPLGPIAWTPPFVNGGGKAETDSPVLTWTRAIMVGTASIYGVYVTNPAKTKLLLVSPFLTPQDLTSAEPSLSRLLQVTEVSEL